MTAIRNLDDAIVATDVRITGGSRGNTGQITIQSDVTEIVGRNDQRYALLIENIGAVIIEIGFTDSLVMGSGHPLAVGAIRGFETTAALYGIVAGGAGLLAYTEEVA